MRNNALGIIIMLIMGVFSFPTYIEAHSLNPLLENKEENKEADNEEALKLEIPPQYEAFSSIETVKLKLSNYERSQLTNYETVIDQTFRVESMSDFFNPYYYYSINMSSGARETNRTKIVSSYCNPYHYEVAMTLSDGTFEHVGCLETFEQAEQLKDEISVLNIAFGELDPVVLHDGMIVMSFGPAVVQFKTTGCGANHNLSANNDSNSNHNTYVNACYIDEALLLDEEENDLQIYMSGYDGWISRHPFYDASSDNETWVSIVPRNQVQNVSYYKRQGQELIHYISKDIRDELAVTPITIGLAPNFMEEETIYYSYDGIYFYSDWADINPNGTGALNEQTPFYNYFQYLPYRSKTNYRVSEIDEYIYSQGITDKAETYPAASNQSQLAHEGEAFISAQEEFGINGALELSMAIHESGFGKSRIAIEKYNLFGMNATDNNPYGNATQFSSVRNGVYFHADRYMSGGYTDALTDYRYHGSHVGNKGSGMNVKYASDPYWGEKIAGQYYKLDKALGFKDYGYYQIGIKQDDEVLTIFEQADSSSSVVYQTQNNKSQIALNHYPILILNKENGFAKIQSDILLDEQGGQYVFNQNIAYLPLESLYLVGGLEVKMPSDVKNYLQLNLGDTLLLEPYLLDIENAEVKTEDHEITIETSEILTAVNPGLATITVFSNGEVVGEFDIRVVVPVDSIAINSSEAEMKVGQALQLKVEVLPENASNQEVMWISSDATIASVDEAGVVTAMSAGVVTIQVLSDEAGLRDEMTIVIN